VTENKLRTYGGFCPKLFVICHI